MTSTPPVFVVSTGRAGSQMLARALAKVPGVLALHEPKPHLITEGYLRWKRGISSEEAARCIRSKRSDLIDQVAQSGLTYIESSHYCSHLIPELARLFDARFVFLHRDPRGFTRSGLARPGWYSAKGPAERFKSLIRQRLKVGAEVGYYWHDHRLDPPAHLSTRMEKIAWLWTEMNRVIVRDLEAVAPDRKLEFRLDAVGPESFGALLAFVGGDGRDASTLDAMLAVAERKPNKRKHQPASVEDWDEEAFRSITEAMAGKLGYCDETAEVVA